MYVRRGLGENYSIVQPANPTPQNDIALFPRGSQPGTDLRIVRGTPEVPRFYNASFTGWPPPAVGQSTLAPAAAQPVATSATAATPAPTSTGLIDWLQTGNNGIYAAIAAAVLLILLTRRR